MYEQMVCTCGFQIGAIYPLFYELRKAHNEKIRASYDGAQTWAINIMQNEDDRAVENGVGYILDMLHVESLCCRAMMFTAVRFDDELYKGVRGRQ